jgi:hypothetical protein
MQQPDIVKVERHLAAVISEKRREAIAYTILTVLATPAFVILFSLVVGIVFADIFSRTGYDSEGPAIYTGLALFLGYMLISILSGRSFLPEIREIDKKWWAAAAAYFMLLFLTYGTPLRQQNAVLFGIVYGFFGFLILGLLGQVQMSNLMKEDTNPRHLFTELLLAASGFIAIAYGEIARGSWLWVPPKLDELRAGAWILCELASQGTASLDARAANRRILVPLRRLKLVRLTEDRLSLTAEGMDFVEKAARQSFVRQAARPAK